MTGLCKHPLTGQWWFRKATPSDLLAKRNELAAMGIKVTREVKHTLAIHPKEAFNKREAEARASKANATCLETFEAMRNALTRGPASLTGMQITAMAGDIARRILKSDPDLRDDVIVDVSDIPELIKVNGIPHRLVDVRGSGEIRVTWQHTVDLFALIAVHGLDQYKGIRRVIDKLVAKALLMQGIIAIDNQSRSQLEARIVKDLPAHAHMLAGMQEAGDYRLPEVFKGRPELDVAFPKVVQGKVTFDQLIAGWILNRKPRPNTVKAYRNWCKAFIRWFGNDDVSTITRKQMIAYRDALQADPKLNDKGRKGKLDGVRCIIEWGITNEKLPYQINPAKGVTVDASKSEVEAWPDEQAALMLTKARDKTGYLRWGTLLMAVTGARAVEIAQLRVSDVQEDSNGKWSLRITAKAGPLKTEASERVIPLHSVVISEGLPAFVNGLKSGGDVDARLFPKFFAVAAKRGKQSGGSSETSRLSQSSGNKYRKWIYGAEVGLKQDKRYSSRHSWRHRVATLMRAYCENDAEARIADLVGHAKVSITSRYGKAAPMKLLRDAVESIPSDAIFGRPIGAGT